METSIKIRKISSSSSGASQFPVQSLDPRLLGNHPISKANSLAQLPGDATQALQPDSENMDGDDPMAQVTSVSQLRDVQPTDWAFQALQSLVERYGCIAGYPDSTFRGHRALTRYEFAAGVNACLNKINELIASATSGLVRKEDIQTLQKLQEQFSGEIATLGSRVDTLEAHSAEIEANQFSTTTRLNGLVWLNLTGARASGKVKVESTPNSLNSPVPFRQAGRGADGRPLVQTVGNPQVTLSSLAWLSFNTSFTGKDNLITQFAAGNGSSPPNTFVSAGLNNAFGVPFFDQTSGTNPGVNDVVIRELFYTFPLTKDIQVGVGPRLNWHRVFDNNRFTFILTGASSFNSTGSTLLNSVARGSGAIVLWKPNKQFQLNLGYLGENNEFLPGGLYQTSPDPKRGLFGGTYSATAELTFSPTRNLDIRLLYNHARLQQNNGRIVAPGQAIYGIVDADTPTSSRLNSDGTLSSGELKSSNSDTYEANIDWLIMPKIGVFGRYTYGSNHLKPIGKNLNAQAIEAGLGFPDLGKQGALATLSYIIPFSVLDGRRFLISNHGDGGVEYDIEASYYYPLTDYLAVVPAFYFVKNINNFKSNPSIYVGNIRLQFSF